MTTMDLEVRHLRILCAIAEVGSLNKAAARLGIGQPTLSHQLRRIERALGGSLFEREAQGVRPTWFGAHVLARARAITAAFAEIERDFLDDPAEADAVLRIGWSDSAIAADLVGCLRKLLPGRAVRTRADLSLRRLVSQVDQSLLDVALVKICGSRRLTRPAGTRARTLVAEPSFVALPATHPLADRDTVRLAELAGDDWIIADAADGCRSVFREACLEHGFVPRITHDVDSAAARRAFVAGGHGVCLTSPTVAERPGLVIRPLAGCPLVVRHVLVWRAGSGVEFCLEELRTAMAKTYRDLARGSGPYRRWMQRTGYDPIEPARYGPPVPDVRGDVMA